MSVCLSPEELEELTEKKRPSAQARQLHALGIPYKPRDSGTLVVYRHDVPNGLTPKRRFEPCFDHIRRKA